MSDLIGKTPYKAETRTGQTTEKQHALWELFKNGVTWLSNLKRASKVRKEESRQAVRSIITAARETSVYMREMSDTEKRNHGKEARLSTHWTTLGFQLQDLGIDKLAKRC